MNPSWIEDRTGIKASESRREPVAKGTYANGQPHVLPPAWMLKTTEREYEIEAALWRLIEPLEPWCQDLSSYAQSTASEVIFACHVTITEDRPLYELSPKLMTTMANFGASFLMDIYDYSE